MSWMLSISRYQCHAVLSLSGEVIYLKCYNVFLETLLFEETYMPAAHLCSPVWLQLSSEASRSRTEKTQELGCGQQAETYRRKSSESQLFYYFKVGPDWYGIFWSDDDTNIMEEKHADIQHISCECGYQILVTKTCNGGRISYILTKFIPNISALNTSLIRY